MASNFKVKIIGGKLVHVPEFDYLQEYDRRLCEQQRAPAKHPAERYGSPLEAKRTMMTRSQPQISSFGHLPEGYEIFSQPAKVSNRTANQSISRDFLRWDDGICKDTSSCKTRTFPNEERDDGKNSGDGKLYRSGLANSNPVLDLRVSNHRQAEKNKQRAKEQLYSSSLALDPVPSGDWDEECKNNARKDAALAKQVADCLENTNKQKLAYAKRAMKRLDINGKGYITLKEFRDVLLMYQIFIIGGALEKLIEKFKSNSGKIKYNKLWNFVLNSYESSHGSRSSKITVHDESDEERTIVEAKRNLQKVLRRYAEEHKGTFNVAEMEASFQHCDRTGTSLMHMKEMGIICRYYLPIAKSDLDSLLAACDRQSNKWVDYHAFLKILRDAEPTYLPPVRHVRRGTYTIESGQEIILHPGMDEGREAKREAKREARRRRGRKKQTGSNESADHYFSPENDDQSDSVKNSKDNGDHRMERRGTDSPRRTWDNESDDSWKKRKRRDAENDSQLKPATRRKWEHSTPVRSLRGSPEEALQTPAADYDELTDASDSTIEEGKEIPCRKCSTVIMHNQHDGR